MSARPTDVTLSAWATNVNYAGGPQVGTPTKLVPAAGRYQDGWRNNDVPPGQEQNYWQNQVGQWIAWFDNGGDVSLVALAARADALPGQKVFVQNLGWYMFVVARPSAPDGIWIIDASAAMGGTACWIQENYAHYTLKHFPSIGPVPGESFPSSTPAGRINPAVVPNGHLVHGSNTSHVQYNTTSAAPVVLATLANITNLAVSDLIQFSSNCTARGNSAANFDFKVWIEVQQNGGGFADTTNTGGGTWRAKSTNEQMAIPLDFAKPQVAGTTFDIRLMGQSDGTNQLIVDLNFWMYWATRP